MCLKNPAGRHLVWRHFVTKKVSTAWYSFRCAHTRGSDAQECHYIPSSRTGWRLAEIHLLPRDGNLPRYSLILFKISPEGGFVSSRHRGSENFWPGVHTLREIARDCLWGYVGRSSRRGRLSSSKKLKHIGFVLFLLRRRLLRKKVHLTQETCRVRVQASSVGTVD